MVEKLDNTSFTTKREYPETNEETNITNSHDNNNFEEGEGKTKKIEQEKEKDEQINKLKELLFDKNKEDILTNFFELKQKTLDELEKLWEYTEISADNLTFLNNKEYIKETQKWHKELFEKLKKFRIKFNEIKNNLNEENIENIINFKKEFEPHKIASRLKKLKKYEQWEYINFTNWIHFELCKWDEAKIPPEVKIWTNDFFLKTHIEKNTKKYLEYVDSLIEARTLFQKKYEWKNIKYCCRSTRLANRKFIETYEEIRKKRKKSEWKEYQKSNRLKVLEQTQCAEVYSTVKTNSNPIKFIKENKDRNLYKFANNSTDFHEAEMWLDINILADNKETEKEYTQAFISLIANNEESLIKQWFDLSIVNKLKERKNYTISIQDIENIYNILAYILQNSKNSNLRKFCLEPNTIEKFNAFNCSWASLLMISIINTLWWTAKLIRVHHHYICIAKLWDKTYLIDTINKQFKDITEKTQTESKNKDIEVITLKNWEELWTYWSGYNYTKWYIINSTSKADKISKKNYITLFQKWNEELKEKYKEIIDYLWWEEEILKKIDEYNGTQVNMHFPKDDKMNFELSKSSSSKEKLLIKLKYKLFYEITSRLSELKNHLKK